MLDALVGQGGFTPAVSAINHLLESAQPESPPSCQVLRQPAAFSDALTQTDDEVGVLAMTGG